MAYIRQGQLPALKEYKYSGVDHSLLSRYVLKPFYTNFVIHCFPISMAPNAITLTGFGFVVVNLLTLLYYNPTLDQDCPPWVYFTFGIGLFLYQTFDAVDGQQARRTKQSGPLGELFDHGVDACNTFLEVLLFAGATNLGQGWKTVATLGASLLTFYVQTWEEYHTHTLTLGIISGPVEGILTLCIVYITTGFIGRGSFWAEPMLNSIGIGEKSSLLPSWAFALAWNDWYMVYGGIVLIFNTISSIQNVMHARRARGQDPIKPLLGLSPFVGRCILAAIYLHFHPIILHTRLVAFTFYIGLANAYSVGQMIVCHLTKSPFPFQNAITWPLILGTLDAIGPWLISTTRGSIGWPSVLSLQGFSVSQVSFLYLCLGLAVGVYGSFVVNVIVTICDYLDIWCLTIKYPVHNETGRKDN